MLREAAGPKTLPNKGPALQRHIVETGWVWGSWVGGQDMGGIGQCFGITTGRHLGSQPIVDFVIADERGVADAV